jgi:hypothetical protein
VRSPLRLLTLVLALVAGSFAAVPAAGAYPSSEIEFSGHGWGHGRGLGQYGALGYAVDEDQSYSTILDHFYGGTTKGSKADGLISVKLVEFDGTTAAPRDLLVTSAAAFTLVSDHEDAIAANTAAQVHWNGSGWDISTAASCAGPWTKIATAPGSVAVEARPTYGGDDV